jgi:hypothetical protein
MGARPICGGFHSTCRRNFLNRSDGISDLAAALVEAHAEIKGVAKSADNPFFKSKYATLESVVEAVKAPLLKRGIVVVQGVQDAEGGVAIETMLLHKSGQWLSSTLRLPASKQDAQGYGSAISYGRRYGLMAICGVPASDDDGNAATASAPAKPQFQSVSKDAWDECDEETKKFLQGLADQAREIGGSKGWQEAYAFLKEQNLQPDEAVACWSRFDSKERAAMEPHKRPKKAA